MNKINMLLAATNPNGVVSVLERQNLEDGTVIENTRDVTIPELISLGADINLRDDNGNNALIFAAFNNCVENIKILLKQQNIAVNQSNNTGLTPLMAAVIYGNHECVNALMEHFEIDANLKDSAGKTALTYALENNQNLVNLLNQHRNSSDPTSQESIPQILKKIEENKLSLNLIIYYVVNYQKNEGQEWEMMLKSELANPEVHKLLTQQVMMEIAVISENSYLREQIISNFNQEKSPSLRLTTNEYPPIAGTKEFGIQVIKKLISLRDWHLNYLLQNGANHEEAWRIAEKRTANLYNNTLGGGENLFYNKMLRQKALSAVTEELEVKQDLAVAALINEVLDEQNLEELQLIANEDIAAWRDNWLSKIIGDNPTTGYSAILYLLNKSPEVPVNIETLRILLEKGVDPNSQTVSGCTAAMKLCSNEKQLDLLIRYGANLDVKDDQGRSITKIGQDERFAEITDKKGLNQYLDDDHAYLTNDKDPRHISGGGWRDLVESITKTVENRRTGKYPIAHLNSDNSVSLLTEKHSDKLYYQGDYQHYDDSDLIAYYMQQEFVTKQLELWRERFGFEIIGGQQLVEKTEHAAIDLAEYKINLSPQNLDSILKLDGYYIGYNKHASILNLNRQFNLKEGRIMLFPVWPIDEGKRIYSIRAAGCQLNEMPTLQLMKLLPNYKTEIQPLHEKRGFEFHHVPAEVTQALNIERNFSAFLQEFMGKRGIDIFSESIEERSNVFNENARESFFEIVGENRDVHIVEIDETAKSFYAMYGNSSEEELGSCLSFEVDSIALLQAIKQFYEYEAGSDKINTINQMIENEKRLPCLKPNASIKKFSAEDFVPEKKTWKNILNNKNNSRDDSTIIK